MYVRKSINIRPEWNAMDIYKYDLSKIQLPPVHHYFPVHTILVSWHTLCADTNQLYVILYVLITSVEGPKCYCS